jgi:cytochrome c-type biogenesis protein CcmH
VTVFIVICAVMLVAAIALVAVPLVRKLPAAAKGDPVAPRSTVATVALVVGLPLVAAGLYGGLSNFPWDNPQAAAALPPGHESPGDAGSMAEVTAQLEARLASNPGDGEGWRMLGRTYLVSGQAARAVEAYRKADAIAGGQDPDLRLDLAEALVLAADPASQEEAGKILDAALTADASNQKALWYSGLMAARRDDRETARTNWTKLLETNPPDEIRQIIVAQLQAIGVEVPGGAGVAAAPSAVTPSGSGPTQASASTGRTIRVALSVDPALSGKLRPGTPLFVSARQPGIPGPPLAAVRLTSDELPTTVVLSDANSMIEGRDLSSVDEVQLVARVAFAGTAVTASGDLIGEASHKKGAAPDVSIVINRVSP